MVCKIKIIQELPFGVKPLTPAEFAGDRKCVLVEMKKATLLGVDNQVVVVFPKGLVDTPSEAANVLIASGAASLYGYEAPERPKPVLKAKPKSRKVGY
jgi:hypothetical protein